MATLTLDEAIHELTLLRQEFPGDTPVRIRSEEFIDYTPEDISQITWVQRVKKDETTRVYATETMIVIE